MRRKLLALFIITGIDASSQDYFQQEVNYKINVELDDQDHVLIGREIIEYTNNSPDDLDFLWFHIWPNAYKDNTTALAKQKKEDGDLSLEHAVSIERGYISGLNFTVDGKKIEWRYHPEHIDICKLILNKPIKAGESITIKTPFKVKIPDAKFSRLGHVDQSYMITQWYPKPAVYDKDGWHEMPYLDQGEFYSEFGRFEVSITLPKNYTVGATGDLQNQDELERLDSLSDKTMYLIANQYQWSNTDMSFPSSSNKTKTLTYIQDRVHDFGWFADKRYHVLKGEVTLPQSQRKVTLYTMFTNNEGNLWKNSIEYMHDAVYYYSLWNGDYPYNYCTAVDGTIAAGGGMEYPNVTVIGTSWNAKALEEVIMHEVGHNWFYGILGNNERDHPWLDEGLNSFDELRYMRRKYPNYNMLLSTLPKQIIKMFDLEDYSNKQMVGELGYMLKAWIAKDQPIELTSAEYTPGNYGIIVYMKSAIVFDYLMAYLGEPLFDKCMKSYYEKWKFRHPQPKDLKETFENKTGKNLSWFFDNMITTTNQLDYSIHDIKKEGNNLYITLKNNGNIPGPVIISGVKDGNNDHELWIEGFEGKKIIEYMDRDYDHIRIDYNGVMPETNRNNNIYKIKGIFKKCEPIKMQLLGSMYHPEKTQIFFLPNLQWNKYNQTSIGVSLYNHFIPKDGISYRVSPMYSFGSGNLVGKGNVSYNKYSHSSIFSHIKIGLDAQKYLYNQNREYVRISPSVRLTLKKPSLRDKKEKYLTASYIHLDKEEEENIQFTDLGYIFSNARTINPYSIHVNLENSNTFTKTDIIFNSTLNKKIMIRAYVGGMIRSGDERYNLQMSAWNGLNDYTFSERSLARSDSSGSYSKQIFIREGGLKHITNIESSSWIGSISIDHRIYSKLLSLYAEAGTNGEDISYGTGGKINLGPITLYIPLYTENGYLNNQKIQNAIRISLDINVKDILGSAMIYLE